MGGGGNSEGKEREEKVRREEQESNGGYGTKGGMAWGVKQSDGRYERCPILHDSQMHLQHIYYLTALQSYCLAHTKDAAWRGERGQKKTEIRRVMEVEGTLNSLTQTICSYHGECRAQYLTNLQCVAVF